MVAIIIVALIVIAVLSFALYAKSSTSGPGIQRAAQTILDAPVENPYEKPLHRQDPPANSPAAPAPQPTFSSQNQLDSSGAARLADPSITVHLDRLEVPEHQAGDSANLTCWTTIQNDGDTAITLVQLPPLHVTLYSGSVIEARTAYAEKDGTLSFQRASEVQIAPHEQAIVPFIAGEFYGNNPSDIASITIQRGIWLPIPPLS